MKSLRASRRWLVAGGLAAALSVLPQLAGAAGVFNPESFTLKNGLQVVVIPNHRVPVISHMVWYRVGAADETAGKTGLAHMLEHMMFKGTREVPAGQFSHIVATNGGRDNAFTTADYTAYFQNVAADKLELVMTLEADRMANLVLKDADFQPERQVVLEERRMRVENEPQGLLDEQMEAALYLNSPYHHPVIGWRNEIENYTIKDVADFYHRWYAPNNAILVISGDVTAARVKPLAERIFGPLRARALPPRQRTDEPPPVAERTVLLRDPEVQQPSWNRLYLAPSYHQGDTGSAYPLQVLAEVLGGGGTSRLYQSLVVDQELAAWASAAYDPDAVGLTSFAFQASPRPGIAMDRLGAAVTEQIAKVAKEGVTDLEVARAKQRLQATVAYARDSLQAGPRVLGQTLATGGTIEEEEAWPDRIGAVTTAQVNDAARAVLQDQRSVIGLLLAAGPGESTTEAVTGPPGSRPPAGLSGRELR